MLQFISFFLLFFSDPPVVNFEAQVIDNHVAIGYGIALGDVDGDGKTDILLADKKQFVWYRNGDWKKFVMVENLTERDDVCIAAMDITGDSKVEVAVGAQWNPGETGNAEQSGSVHYLIASNDRTQPWKAIRLPHEPTTHRMRWAKAADGKYHLIVTPLHGRNNKNGEGAGVKIIAYAFPENVDGTWPTKILDDNMHLTHNLDIVQSGMSGTDLYFAGKEGVRMIRGFSGGGSPAAAEPIPGMEFAAGEIKVGKTMIATIEPMHGTTVVAYLGNGLARAVLDDQLKEGHALAVGDFTGTGSEQVVAGWRVPNAEGKVGIKLYYKTASSETWDWQWVDENGMACEDLQLADLNGDGKPDIVAAGRATNNLKIYWNR